MSRSGHYGFFKFSNTLVFSDPEPKMIKLYKDDQQYQANLDCDLFQLIHHNFIVI